MTDHINEPSRLELYKAGKLEERRYPRQHPEPVIEVENEEDDNATINLRPEVMAIALLVAVLLIVTAIAL